MSYAITRDGEGRAPSTATSRVIVILCLVAGVVAWGRLGGEYARQLRPDAKDPTDFLQEWASARNHLNGLPVYSPHSMTIPLYLGRPQADWEKDIAYNAHPPTSVLLALPFARLPLRDAVLAWNLVTMMALLAGMLLLTAGLPELKTLFLPVAVLLPFCLPIYGNFQQGQPTFILVLLTIAAWYLDRSDRPGIAGLMIGAAASVKLFPAYLVVYFAARGRWRGVFGAAAAFAALNLAAATVLGREACADYVRVVLPSMEKFQSYGFNLSFSGFLHKLFDPASERGWIVPLWYSPAAARWGTLVADLLATAMVARAAWRARTRDERDLAFGLATAAMLLVSPITWDYSLPLLLLPFAILTRAAMASRWLPVPLVPVLVIFGLPQKNVMKMILAGQEARVATPGFMLGLPSLSFYALLATFVMLAVLAWPRPSPRPESP